MDLLPDLPQSYSYGGGVQSTAMLVLVGEGYLPPGPFLFSNVGEDSEHPATIRYVREVAFEYAASRGIEIHELERVATRGKHKGPITLWREVMDHTSRSIPIPVRMGDNGAPGTRQCTGNYKIRVVQKWIKEHGATAANPWAVNVGISTDEFERASSRTNEPYERLAYPLLTLEHRLAPSGASRAQCAAIIRDAGLPVPPKSSCFFCPFHKPTVWADMARDEPELFERSCTMEDTLNVRRSSLPCPGAGRWPAEAVKGKRDDDGSDAEVIYLGYDSPDGKGACPSCRSRQPITTAENGQVVMAEHARGPVYLTRFGKPLRSVFGGSQQLSLLAPGWDEDEGYRCGDVCDT